MRKWVARVKRGQRGDAAINAITRKEGRGLGICASTRSTTGAQTSRSRPTSPGELTKLRNVATPGTFPLGSSPNSKR